jgi:hypothetical protein
MFVVFWMKGDRQDLPSRRAEAPTWGVAWQYYIGNLRTLRRVPSKVHRVSMLLVLVVPRILVQGLKAEGNSTMMS